MLSRTFSSYVANLETISCNADSCSCVRLVAFAGKNDGRLDIYWVDVEGGAATLIVTPAGRIGADRYRQPGRARSGADL